MTTNDRNAPPYSTIPELATWNELKMTHTIRGKKILDLNYCYGERDLLAIAKFLTTRCVGGTL